MDLAAHLSAPKEPFLALSALPPFLRVLQELTLKHFSSKRQTISSDYISVTSLGASRQGAPVVSISGPELSLPT